MVCGHFFAKVKTRAVVNPLRVEQVLSLFRVLDADRDGFLNSQEMRRFSEYMGFAGTAAEWQAEYALIVDNLKGVDVQLFNQLVDDESEDAGCYCTDDELSSMLEHFENSQPASAARKPIGPPIRTPPGLGLETQSPTLCAHDEPEPAAEPAEELEPAEEAWEWCTETSTRPLVAPGKNSKTKQQRHQPQPADTDGDEGWATWDTWKKAASSVETPSRAAGAASDSWNGHEESWWAGGSDDWSWSAGNDWSAEWSEAPSWQSNSNAKGKGAGKGSGKGKGKGGKKDRNKGW